MIFGNAEFMGMPFEPIIKGFRASEHARPKDTLTEYAEAFFSYLEQQVSVEDEMRKIHLSNIFESVFQELFRTAFDKLFKMNMKASEKLADRLALLIIDEIDQKLADIASKNDCETLSSVTAEELAQLAESEVNVSLQKFVAKNPPSDDVFAQLTEKCKLLIGQYLKKDVFSDQSTGIAFSGFGTKENFPSLLVFDTEGLISGVVKRKLVKTEVVNPQSL